MASSSRKFSTSSEKFDALEKAIAGEPCSHAEGLDGDVDVFNGVNVRAHHIKDLDPESFLKRLTVSLDLWRKEGRRGIWIKIPIAKADLIPVATKSGFEFHHAKKGYVMLTRWLPDTPSPIPGYPHHSVGVGGFVVNDKNQLLVIQERYLVARNIPIWKVPGGMADPGENLAETAIREVKEETGIDTEFVTLISFRHMHEFRWGTDDFFFICLLKPLSTEINIDTREIAACKWIDIDEYIDDPKTITPNRLIAESYLKCCKNGFSFCPESFPHHFPGKPDQVQYSLDAFPPTTNSSKLPHPQKNTSDDETTAHHKL